MKVFIKRLGGTQFQIEVNPEDTVADVKKNIETVKGYLAANQILVHRCQVLKDRTFLEEDNDVSENSVIIMMVSPTPRKSVTYAPQLRPPTMTLRKNVFGQAGSCLVAGNNLDSDISEQGGLSASSGIMSVNWPAKPVQVTQLPVVPPNGSNLNPLDLFPEDLPTSAGATNNLDFLRDSLHFKTFPAMVLTNSRTLLPMHNTVRKHNRQLASLITENISEYFHLDLVTAEFDARNPFLILWRYRKLTPEDMLAIERLQTMGFNRRIIKEAFFACNKNENQAANFLWNLKRGFKDCYP